MSTLKVNNIQNASGTDAISIGSDGSLSYPNIGRRNLIINGAMQVAQRGTSFTVSSNAYTLDRWLMSYGSSATVTSTVTQDSDAPDYFSNSLKIETTNTVSPDTGKNFGCFYSFEGQDLQMLSYGSSAARTLTISFWVKSSKTGTYGFQIVSNGKTRTILNSYIIDSANTWEYKTITIEGDTASDIDNNNLQSLRLIWPLYTGPDDINSTTGWFSSGSFLSVTNQVNLFDTTGATWQITGVQLEVGSVATPFEHRSYGEELALCQRYYFNTDIDTGNSYASLIVNAGEYNSYQFKVRMRSTPTMTLSPALGTLSNLSVSNSGFYVQGSSTSSMAIEADAEL